MKILLSTVLIATSLLANNIVDRSATSELNYSQAGIFEYDATNGWWWYKEKTKDKDGKEIEVKEKMTTKEKLQHEREEKVVKLLQKQNDKLGKIQDRLEYAYPNLTPIYTTNKKTGEKCLTNSSIDCFIFPLQAEAQHVPVLASWLSNPSPTNSKEWLRWEAEYFNHLQKISLGNRFAFLSEGPNAYGTNTTFVYDDNLGLPISEKLLSQRETKILESVKDKLGLLFFMGGNTYLENSLNIYDRMDKYVEGNWKDMDIRVIVPSEEIKKMILEKAKHLYVENSKKFWKTVKIQVNAEAFKKFNVMVTPSVVATYQTDKIEANGKKKVIWQNVYTGAIDAMNVKEGVIRFLVYNDIIKPVEMSTAINAAEAQKNMHTEKPIINEKNIFEDTQSLGIKNGNKVGSSPEINAKQGERSEIGGKK